MSDAQFQYQAQKLPPRGATPVSGQPVSIGIDARTVPWWLPTESFEQFIRMINRLLAVPDDAGNSVALIRPPRFEAACFGPIRTIALVEPYHPKHQLSSLLVLLAARLHGKEAVLLPSLEEASNETRWSPLVSRLRNVMITRQTNLPAPAWPVAIDEIKHVSRSELQPRLLLFADRLHAKEVESVVKAARLIQLKYPRTELTVGLSGTAADAGMQSSDRFISFTAVQSLADRSSLLAQSDLLIVADAQANSAAMVCGFASGTPVVATPAAGSRLNSLAADTEQFAPYDWRALADQVISLVESPARVQMLSESGWLRAQRFAPAQAAYQWADYFRVLSSTDTR